MGKYFGTDGIRGVFGKDLTPEFSQRVGLVAAAQFPKARCVIGRDTRESGAVLLHSLCEGLCRGGVDVLDLGVLPTPAVARLIARYQADFGIVISASHNPWRYNGIKFFNADCSKFSDAQEAVIETSLESLPQALPPFGCSSVVTVPDAPRNYVNLLCSTLSEDVSPLRVVADCANGAAVTVVKRLFEAIGCRYTLLHAHPDGLNINRGCGSTHPEVLQKAVCSIGADVGIAFDGDADRCLCVDEKGGVVDGDVMMALLAADGLCAGKPLVGTVMTNLGVVEFCRRHGIPFAAAPVGDRHVLRHMLELGSVLGGEQSGHIIFRDLAMTGDGPQTALQMLQYLVRQRRGQQGATLSQLARRVERYPQVQKNLPVEGCFKQSIIDSPRLQRAVKEAENALGECGRVLVRASGTEDLIRVLAEGPDAVQLEQIAVGLAQVIGQETALR